jgi:N-acetylneuraminic acid mutarotase/TorA maturation chaperone TorD
MPTARSNLAAVSIDNKIYAIGGFIYKDGKYSATSLVEVYDTLTDTWISGKSLPISSGLIGAVVIERKIYVLCGETSQLFVFDVDKNEWSELQKLPADANTGSFGMAVVQGKIYVARGSGEYPSGIYWTYCYDPISNTWTKKSPIPYHRTIESFAELNGKLYAIGGGDPSLGRRIEVTRVDVYDPTSDSWTLDAIPRMSTPRTHLEPETPVVNGKIYVIGGWDGYSTLNSTEEYDPTTNSWRKIASMPTARYALATAVVGNKIYAMGGDSGGYGGNPKNANEELTIEVVLSVNPDVYAKIAEGRSKVYECLAKTYEYHWFKAQKLVQDLMKSVVEDLLKAEISSLLPGTASAMAYLSMVNTAEKIRQAVSWEYSYYSYSQLKTFIRDQESTYKSTYMKESDYPTDFINFIKAVSTLGGMSLYDAYKEGDQFDCISIEIFYMQWLCLQEESAWKQKDLKLAKQYLVKQKEFLTNYLGDWLPSFKDNAYKFAHLLQYGKEDKYLELISDMNDFVQSDKKFLSELTLVNSIRVDSQKGQISQGETLNWFLNVIEEIKGFIIKLIWGGSDLDIWVVDPLGKNYTGIQIYANEEEIAILKPVKGYYSIFIHGKFVPQGLESFNLSIEDIIGPIANAGGNQVVDEDTFVILNGSLSWDSAGIVSFTWHFFDREEKVLTGMICSYIFETPGMYNVTLKVEDVFGNTDADTITIKVNDITKPLAFAGEDKKVKVGSSIIFNASLSTDNVGIVKYEWDFGDGTTGEGMIVEHSYSKIGVYNVTLTVKDAAGNVDTHSITVTVIPAEDLSLWIISVSIVVIFLLLAIILYFKKRRLKVI